jgi:hypothetical protein
MLSRQIASRHGSSVGGGNGARKKCIAQIIGDVVSKCLYRLQRGLWIDHPRLPRIQVVSQKDARAAIPHHEDSWQYQSWNLAKGALDGLDFQSSACGGAFKQESGKLSIRDGQSRQEGCPTYCSTMKCREIQQSVGERISFACCCRRRLLGLFFACSLAGKLYFLG